MEGKCPSNQQGFFMNEDSTAVPEFVELETPRRSENMSLLPLAPVPVGERVAAYLADLCPPDFSNMALCGSERDEDSVIEVCAPPRVDSPTAVSEAHRRVLLAVSRPLAIANPPATDANDLTTANPVEPASTNDPTTNEPAAAATKTPAAKASRKSAAFGLLSKADAEFLRAMPSDLFDAARRQIDCRSESDLSRTNSDSASDLLGEGHAFDPVFENGADIVPDIELKDDKIKPDYVLEAKMPPSVGTRRPFFQCNGACGTG